MATLTELLRARPGMAHADVEWLHLLVGDWQLVADLSFADLVLWLPDEAAAEQGGPQTLANPTWQAVAHVRPTTGQLVFVDDQVGVRAAHGQRRGLLNEAAAGRRIVRARGAAAPELGPDGGLREEYIPIVRDGRVLGVVTRHTNLWTTRTPSRLEITYLATADALCRMMVTGEFPFASAPTGMRRGAPRVGDGVFRLDVDGLVTYASPNAVSALHRIGHLGEIVGSSLAQMVTDNIREAISVDEGLPLVVTGRQPWRSEVAAGGTTISMRAIPLTENGQRYGAVVLVRDVGELRRREQELLTKDATIREIHHRVKNNLQSVAALLRLQARRVPEGEARDALREAERRVGTIALVHDQMSQAMDDSVDFDAVATKGVAAIAEVANHGAPVRTEFGGTFGQLRPEDGTALAMIISELVQNAVEHGLQDNGGLVNLDVHRSTDDRGQPMLTVTVEDDGAGIDPQRRPGSGLGTQIVQSLVADLGGRISWEPRSPKGTRARFTASLRPLR